MHLSMRRFKLATPARTTASVRAGTLARLRAEERAMALIAALGILVVLTIAGTAVTEYATRNFVASGSTKASGGAYGLAEAGINDALSILANQLDSTGAVKAGGIDPRTSTLLPQTTVNYASLGGSVTYSGTINSSYVWTITSTGSVKVGRTARHTTLTRKVSVVGINSGADSASWSRFYQDSTGSCLTIDNTTFVTNVATRGDLCLRNNGAITGSNVTVDVGGNVSISGPDTTSTKYGTGANSGASNTWTNPTRTSANDSSYTTSAIAPGTNSGNSAILNVTGFGFSVPSTAIIRGISVSIERKSSSNSGTNSNYLRDNTVQLLKAGTATGSNKAATGTSWPTSDGVANYGSGSDAWGSTWTASDVNNANFGAKIIVHNYSTNSTSITASIDYVTITVTYSGDTNGIGTSGTPVSTANIGGSCTYNAQSAHTPCTSTDHVYAGAITSTSAGSNPALVMPQVDYSYWWANAKPGPKHFCTNANPGLSSTFFDNDAGSTTGPNGSIGVNGEMAPSNSNYDCEVWENGQLVGELKWNHTTHRMDIKGVIFVDGNFRFDEDGEIIHYYGRANIMSSRDDEIDALVCAGGATDSNGNPTGNTYTTSCYPDMSNWDATQNMMVLMSEMPNEYDQGGTSCSGSYPSCIDGYLPSGFQGIMFSTSDCLIHQNFRDSGPVICNTISLPNESGGDPTFYTFPYTGNLTDGQKYHDVATATHFELDLGQQSG